MTKSISSKTMALARSSDRRDWPLLSLTWIHPGLGGLTANKRGRNRKDGIPKEHQNALSKGERVVQEPKQVRHMWSAIRKKKSSFEEYAFCGVQYLLSMMLTKQTDACSSDFLLELASQQDREIACRLLERSIAEFAAATAFVGGRVHGSLPSGMSMKLIKIVSTKFYDT